MRSYEAVTRIDASPADVWALLVDVGGWRDWDSGVDRVEGKVALGEPLIIFATMIRTRPFEVTGPRGTVTESAGAVGEGAMSWLMTAAIVSPRTAPISLRDGRSFPQPVP